MRYLSFDCIRGLLILLMTLGHAVFFFHTGFNPALSLLNRVADTVCFTGLVLISGVTAANVYLHPHISPVHLAYKLSKRLFIYLVGYWIICFIYVINSHQPIDLINYFQILTFQRFVPFTEFIPTLIILGFSKIIFKNIYARLSYSLPLTLLWGTSLYLVGTALAQSPQVDFIYKDLLVGSPGHYSFPLTAYLPIYLIGAWVGRRFTKESAFKPALLLSQLSLGTGLALLGTLTIAIIFQTQSEIIWNRYPPTPGFLLTGLFLTFSLWFVVESSQLLHRHKLLNYLPVLLGQNAFAIYFCHTLGLIIYQSLLFPRTPATTLTLILWFISLSLAIYLAKVLPLNYRFGLTVYTVFADLEVTKDESKKLYQTTQKLFQILFNFPQLFSFRVGSRQIRLLSSSKFLLASLLILVAAAPIGIAEDLILSSQLIQSLKPDLSQTWTINQTDLIGINLTPPPGMAGQLSSFTAILSVNNQASQEIPFVGEKWQGQFDLKGLPFGTYPVAVKLSHGNQHYTTQDTFINYSAPLYISLTTDWEGYDVPTAYLSALANLSQNYQLPLTHFFNPRIWTDPGLDANRAQFLTLWLNDRLSQGDGLGLHLHMFPDYLAKAGLTPKTGPVWGGGVSEGYDILTTAYSSEELIQLFSYAKTDFRSHGLPEPRFYRAGAWFANLDTLTALEATGFLADSSGRTAYNFGTNHVAGFWQLDPGSRPFYPSVINQNSALPPPNFTVLEIPNNGADDYAFTEAEMISRFTDNFNQKPLEKAQQITYLTHPMWLDQHRQQKLTNLFKFIGQYQAINGTGPVVFASFGKIYDAFK